MTREFTEPEIATIRELLVQHYHRDVEIRMADNEVLLTADDTDPTLCPAVFWYQGETNFVVVKTGDRHYRTEFFYTPHEQYDTGTREYNDLGQCVNEVLRAQEEHQRGADPDNADATHN